MRRFLFLAVFVAIFSLSVSTLAYSLPKYQAICERLGELEGYTVVDKCSGMNMQGNMGEMVSAEKNYANSEDKEKYFGVTVLGGGQAMMMWMPFMTHMTVETDKELVKVVDIDGLKAGINYDKQENGGSLVVCLSKTPQSGCHAIFGVEFKNMDYKEALDLLKNFDLKSIESLFEE
ncbi:hypothetical protein [Hippea jasoniae]|uniref:hypothetical protein n=1 Tax=Hippea jasoniae TaxID=944479 RepID=UPI000559979C|nr:hypothetical protein [Hippea jasoniae]